MNSSEGEKLEPLPPRTQNFSRRTKSKSHCNTQYTLILFSFYCIKYIVNDGIKEKSEFSQTQIACHDTFDIQF